jgi:hypothetical protein
MLVAGVTILTLLGVPTLNFGLMHYKSVKSLSLIENLEVGTLGIRLELSSDLATSEFRP